MKKKTFIILESVLIGVSLLCFIAFGILKGINNSLTWANITLAFGIISLVVFVFLLIMRIFTNSKLPEVKQGIICPRCHYLNEEGADTCKQCGANLKQNE